jgi:hypothetical protein
MNRIITFSTQIDRSSPGAFLLLLATVVPQEQPKFPLRRMTGHREKLGEEVIYLTLIEDATGRWFASTTEGSLTEKDLLQSPRAICAILAHDQFDTDRGWVPVLVRRETCADI